MTSQVKPRKAPFDAPALTPGEADRVLFVDTYHHIEGRPAYFAKVKNGTSPQWRLVVVDLTQEAPFGPPPPHQYVLVFAPQAP